MTERQFAIALCALSALWLLHAWAARINANAEHRRKIRDAAKYRRQFAAETNLHNWQQARDIARDIETLDVAGLRVDWHGDRGGDVSRDPLDVAVDKAHVALTAVARIAERRGELDLRRIADEARVQLLDAWERAE